MPIAGMDGMLVFWLLLTIAFVVGEIVTVGLTSIWFAAGAVCALLCRLAGAGTGLQIVVFIAVSLVLLFATRPWAKKYLNSKVVKTNVSEHVGKRVVITEKVDNLAETGKTVINGLDWSVRSEDDAVTIDEGETVVVTRISGVKLIVKKEN